MRMSENGYKLYQISRMPEDVKQFQLLKQDFASKFLVWIKLKWWDELYLWGMRNLGAPTIHE